MFLGTFVSPASDWLTVDEHVRERVWGRVVSAVFVVADIGSDSVAWRLFLANWVDVLS